MPTWTLVVVTWFIVRPDLAWDVTVSFAACDVDVTIGGSHWARLKEEQLWFSQVIW